MTMGYDTKRYVIKDADGRYATGRRTWTLKQTEAHKFVSEVLATGHLHDALDWAQHHLSSLIKFNNCKELRIVRLTPREG